VNTIGGRRGKRKIEERLCKEEGEEWVCNETQGKGIATGGGKGGSEEAKKTDQM